MVPEYIPNRRTNQEFQSRLRQRRKPFTGTQRLDLTLLNTGSILGSSTSGKALSASSYPPSGTCGRVVALFHAAPDPSSLFANVERNHVAPIFLFLQQNGYGGSYGRGIFHG